MRIDPSSTSPAFLQIAEAIRAGIASGLYRPGDLIPSIRETALRCLVNPNTVKRAYEELEREGLVTAKKGIGMEVQAATARAAMKRTTTEVREALAQAVTSARRAGMDRPEVDALYDRAWGDSQRSAPDPAAGFAHTGKENDQ